MPVTVSEKGWVDRSYEAMELIASLAGESR
jgi:hypothetical protein